MLCTVCGSPLSHMTSLALVLVQDGTEYVVPIRAPVAVGGGGQLPRHDQYQGRGASQAPGPALGASSCVLFANVCPLDRYLALTVVHTYSAALLEALIGE